MGTKYRCYSEPTKNKRYVCIDIQQHQQRLDFYQSIKKQCLTCIIVDVNSNYDIDSTMMNYVLLNISIVENLSVLLLKLLFYMQGSIFRPVSSHLNKFIKQWLWKRDRFNTYIPTGRLEILKPFKLI
ncbi:Hypothetical_protein [Hexamita inflata]|uniref:Hypothetical_protein n=1 Tax=Hexamita inflata TaxID=28002 RepID=A0AA86NWQ8_9EUKA|nr:Hypothetical protein HINF_LOCUS13721 [Hexamita inflata]